MRFVGLQLLFVLVLAAAAWGQYAAPIGPPSAPPAWGGYAVPAPVPYQPTLPSEPVYGAQPIALPPPPETYSNPAWQPYSTTPAPVAVPFPLPEAYPPATEFNLRQSLIPPDARDGFFQKARFIATWIPQLEDDSLGWTDLRSEVVTALPFFTRENPIIITPAYELHLLDGPVGFDLPPRLHDLEIDFHIFRVYDNRWILDFALTPGLYADDHSFDRDEAFRINGRALAVYVPTPEWKWVLGVTYVHGGWAKIVPIVGFIYEPNDDVKYEAVFPRPRVAWRLASSAVPGRDEFWFYVKGEFDNSIWAFEQSDGTPDVLASRDFRFIVGLEREVVGGIDYFIEAGYVFNRDIKIASISGDDIGLEDSFLLRAGIEY